MLKAIIGSFALLMVFVWFGSAQEVISDCDGWIAIKDDLAWSYVLSGDVDCIYTGNNAMIGDTTLDYFEGFLDGNGYTISYDINASDWDLWLFIGLSWATITNLWLSWSVIGTTNRIWGLAWFTQNSSVLENIFGTVYVAGNDKVGWIIWVVQYSQIFSGIDIQWTVLSSWTNNSDLWGILWHWFNTAGSSITIVNSSFSGTVEAEWNYVGWLGWRISTGYIINSFFSGTILWHAQIGWLAWIMSAWEVNNSSASVIIDGDRIVGWLIGNTLWVSISDSHATVDLSISGSSQLGWLVGSLRGSIVRSYALGTLSGTAQVWWLVGWASSNSTISQSYTDVDIYSTANRIWWLIWYIQDSDVHDSYALGNISANLGNDVGWAIGLFYDGNFSNLYAIGSIDGSGDYYGWLIGFLDNVTGSNSFWDAEASGLTSSHAWSGLTTQEMQSIYTYSWVWRFITLTNDEGPQSYPYLTWQVDSDLSGSNRILSDTTDPVITYTWWDVVNGGTVDPWTVVLATSIFDIHLVGWHMHIYVWTTADFDETWPVNGLFDGWTTPYDSTSIATLAPSFEEGIYYWYAQASDAAGNEVKWAMQMFTVAVPVSQGGGGGGGGWWSISVDHCPNWDFSGSYYDGSCGDEGMTHAEKVVQRLAKKRAWYNEQRIQSMIAIISLFNDRIQMRDDVSNSLKELLHQVILTLKEYFKYTQ